ncbi:class I adenylate-forming enzyme family protein [Microbacterium rhizomatis]|nr:AMP-binding protein [Microbacterium rhizomatis]
MPGIAAPWYALYPEGVEHGLRTGIRNAMELFQASLRSNPDAEAISYFDGTLTYKSLDDEARALAAALSQRGLVHGDRLGICLQNTPHFVIAVLAAWYLGMAVVPINPMYRVDELAFVVDDAGLAVLIVETGSGEDIAAEVLELRPHVLAFAASPDDYQRRADDRVLPSVPGPGVLPSLGREIETHRKASFARAEIQPSDVAFITYTSGTTGRAKGAVNHHAAAAYAGDTYRNWVPLVSTDRILGLAPMSGTTGLITGLVATLAAGACYVLHYRFQHGVIRDAIIEHRPTFVVAPPTLYIALLDDPLLTPEDLSSLTKTYCGGAPVPPTLVSRWRERFGGEIRTAYGLTEATGPTHLAPVGASIPVDPETGALAIGVPVPGTDARIVDTTGADVQVGELGELVIRGPQVVRGYWRNEDATEAAFVDGWLRTGDLVRMSSIGWFFLVDRIKDIIIASGWNVVPREVEDVLYQHPDVREVAVVGIPHPYRGETVRAYVSTRSDVPSVTVAELTSFVRERLAVYKCPTEIEFVTELPKSNNGKILKRRLRDDAMSSVRENPLADAQRHERN